ncbi:YdcF family protein [Gymnodinialimonas sp. 57CJ19]|uniref:YdcF family protein n=1 Tax=Gymnodinialimonas sp. 57CJ19 TaxID=3138498 RepID=UPI0031343C67
MNRAGQTLRLVLLIYLQTLLIVVAVEFFWPRDTLPASADAIICLGGSASQEALGVDATQRAARCVDLFQAGVAPAVIFSGTVAAPLMAEYTLAQGVPEDAVFVEDRSRSTLQNARFTAGMLAPDARVVVVSNAYHLPRSAVSFWVMGYRDVALAAAGPPSLRPRPLLREALAIWFNMGRVVLWWATPWMDEAPRTALLA